MSGYTVHRRQFVISKHPFDHPGFQVIELNGMCLSHHCELEVFQRNGTILLGLAFQTMKDAKDPREQIAEISKGQDIVTLTSSWSGRWLLIHENAIYTDATGNLQCFYSPGDRIVSSSLALLVSVAQLTEKHQYCPIAHREGMDWYPGPLTQYRGVLRLMGNQFLETDAQYKVGRFDQVVPISTSISEEKKIDEICSRLINFVTGVGRAYEGEILVPLTSGYDSRLLFAACVSSNISFTTFTLEHDNLSRADRWIPRIVSSRYGIKHKFVAREAELDHEKLEAFDLHCLRQCVDEDRKFFSHGQFDNLKTTRSRKALLLRGGMWAIGKEVYSDRKRRKNLQVANEDGISEKMDSLSNAFVNVPDSALHQESLMAWLGCCEDAKNDCIAFRTRFYLEQRMGSWLAGLEQALDLTDFERVHPGNCRDIISLLNSLETESKACYAAHRTIINKLAPKLSGIPYNSDIEVNFWTRLKRSRITPARVVQKVLSCARSLRADSR